jgi:predicted transcriptional regulator
MLLLLVVTVIIDLSEIRMLRKRAGLSQQELASRVGVTQSHIAKVEAGRIDPSYGLVRRIVLCLEEEKKDPCSRYMSSPVLGVHDDEVVDGVVREMEERGYSQLVVLRGRKVVGLVTEEDVLRQKKPLSEMRAREVMGHPPATVPKAASREAIVGLVTNLGCVVVLDGEEPVGIITRSDLIRKTA